MKKKKQKKEPELFEKSYMEEARKRGKRPPYIFLALIVFVILSFVWKSFVVHPPAEGEGRTPPVPEHRADDAVDTRR